MANTIRTIRKRKQYKHVPKEVLENKSYTDRLYNEWLNKSPNNRRIHKTAKKNSKLHAHNVRKKSLKNHTRSEMRPYSRSYLKKQSRR